MVSTLDLCEKYFGKRELYEVLEIEKDALPKDIKKAYYKLSMQVHPDRVEEAEKKIATEKFKVLSKIYNILSDKDRRVLYDEQGAVDDEDDVENNFSSWLDFWRKLFKPLSTEDICKYERNYVGSELERSDIKKAYLAGKGCINRMLEDIPFFKIEDEPRLHKIVGEMIAANEVPEYTAFTKELPQKRDRRHKKYARESKQAAEMRAKIEGNLTLEEQILKRSRNRERQFNATLDRIMDQYGGREDDAVDFETLREKTKQSESRRIRKETEAELRAVGISPKKAKKARGSAKKSKPNVDNDSETPTPKVDKKLNGVKKGRVQKAKK